MSAIRCVRGLRWTTTAVLVLAGLLVAEGKRADRAPKAAAKEARAGKASPVKPSAKKAPARRKPPVKKKIELTTKAAAKEAAARIAHLRISGTVLNSPPDFSLFSMTGKAATLREWLQRLAKIRRNDSLAAVALEIDAPGLTWAQAQELSDAIGRLSAAKPVYVHMVSGGALSFLLASAGRELAIDPSGRIMITGLGVELTYFRGTLDLLGIQPQYIQIGRYKSAGESLARTQPSKEFLGEYNKILDDLYEQLCQQIARQRRLTPGGVRKAIDAGPFSAASARRHKLVDRLLERSDWYAHVRQRAAGKGKPAEWLWNYGAKPPQTLDLSNPFALLALLTKRRVETIHDPSIAIIHADGMLVSGAGGESLLGGRLVGARSLAKCFKEAAENDRIKAVVFRIDSPGGSALASELIYQAVRDCGKTKPVIASISQTGASGGYYVAVGARTIFADPCALTGSIGVASGKLALQGLMSKIGVSTYEITRGRNAGLGMSRPWSAREQAVIRRLAQETYDVFARRVRESRGKRVRDIDAVAQGRIFTARQAVANGLIDQVGGLRDAVNLAKKKAKIDACGYLTLPRPKTLADLLGGGASTLDSGMLTADWCVLRHAAARSGAIAYLLNLADLMQREVVVTALPYFLSARP